MKFWINLLTGIFLLHQLTFSSALEVLVPVGTYWGNDGDAELVIQANVTSDAGWEDVTVNVTTTTGQEYPAVTEDNDANSDWKIFTYTIKSLFIEDAGKYVFKATGSGQSKNSTIMVYIHTTAIMPGESSYYVVERTEQLAISAYVKMDGSWDAVEVQVNSPGGQSILPTFVPTNAPFWRFYTATIDTIVEGNYVFAVNETLGGKTRTITSPAMVQISETTAVDEYLYRIGKMSTSIANQITNFYSYLYDGPDNTYILDGGLDMFDRGNYLTVSTKTMEESNVPYGKPYTNANFAFSSLTTYPFTWLMWISNEGGAEDLFSIKVAGQTGAAISGESIQFNSSLMMSSYSIHYSSMQLYNVAPDPSICEVYFHITNEQVWSSVEPTSGSLMVGGSPPTSLENTYTVTGAPKNIMMGYMLLSRMDGSQIAEDEIVTVLENVTSLIEEKDGFTLKPELERVLVEPTQESVTLKARITAIGDWSDISVEIMTPTSTLALDQFSEDGDSRIYEYTIASVSEADSGIYTFKATDGYGFQMQDQTELIVLSSEILVQTSEYWASGGDPELIINVVVTANNWEGTEVLVTLPDGSVTEAETDSTSATAREYTHRITNLFIEDAGVYVFSVERNGTISSRPQNITVFLFTVSVYPDGFNSHTIAKENRATFMVYGICDGDWNNVQGTLTSPQGSRYAMVSESSNAPHIRKFSAIIYDAIGGEYDISIEETLGTRTETRSIKHTVEVHTPTHVDEYLYRIGLKTDELVSYVPGWENYWYDGPDYTYIMDGGYDMYDRGNYISFAWSSGEEVNVPYGKPIQNNVTMFSSKYFYPFVSLMWIGNEDRTEEEFSITVNGRSGALPSTEYETYRRVLFEGTYEVTYHVFQVHGSQDPSICEVYFLITNNYEWQSFVPDSFTLTVAGSPPQDLKNTAQVTGSPSNIMLGYTLLSMANGAQVSYFEVEKILESYVAVIAQRDQFAIEPTTDDGYYTAVSGGNATVEALVTTSGEWDGVNVELVLPSGGRMNITNYKYNNLHTQRVYMYHITNVMDSNRGEYRFIATDKFGEMEETVSNLYVFTHQSMASTTQYVGGPDDTVVMQIFVDSDTKLFSVEIDTPTLGTQPVTDWMGDSTNLRTYQHRVENPTYERDNGNYTFRVKEVFQEYGYNTTIPVNLAVFSVSTEVEQTSYTVEAGVEALEIFVGVTTLGEWDAISVKVDTPSRGCPTVTEFDQTADPQRRNYIYTMREVSSRDAGDYLFRATETLYDKQRTSEPDRITVIFKEIPEEVEKLSGGEIAGIVIGCVAGTVLIGVAVWYCTKQKYSTSSKSPLESPAIDDNTTILENTKAKEADEGLTSL